VNSKLSDSSLELRKIAIVRKLLMKILVMFALISITSLNIKAVVVECRPEKAFLSQSPFEKWQLKVDGLVENGKTPLLLTYTQSQQTKEIKFFMDAVWFESFAQRKIMKPTEQIQDEELNTFDFRIYGSLGFFHYQNRSYKMRCDFEEKS
jgi:hypothetical protein